MNISKRNSSRKNSSQVSNSKIVSPSSIALELPNSQPKNNERNNTQSKKPNNTGRFQNFEPGNINSSPNQEILLRNIRETPLLTQNVIKSHFNNVEDQRYALNIKNNAYKRFNANKVEIEMPDINYTRKMTYFINLNNDNKYSIRIRLDYDQSLDIFKKMSMSTFPSEGVNNDTNNTFKLEIDFNNTNIQTNTKIDIVKLNKFGMKKIGNERFREEDVEIALFILLTIWDSKYKYGKMMSKAISGIDKTDAFQKMKNNIFDHFNKLGIRFSNKDVTRLETIMVNVLRKFGFYKSIQSGKNTRTKKYLQIIGPNTMKNDVNVHYSYPSESIESVD